MLPGVAGVPEGAPGREDQGRHLRRRRQRLQRLQTKVAAVRPDRQRLARRRLLRPTSTTRSWASPGQRRRYAAPARQGPGPAGDPRRLRQGRAEPCTVDGNTYCLRNDLAQTCSGTTRRSWTSSATRVPTTWEEYQALGEKVAKEHPGYIVGAVGDAWTPEVYFWASQCPANTVTGAKDDHGRHRRTRSARAAGEAARQPDRQRLVVHGQRLQPRVRQEAGEQGPHAPRPVLVRPGALQARTFKTPQGPDRRRARR